MDIKGDDKKIDIVFIFRVKWQIKATTDARKSLFKSLASVIPISLGSLAIWWEK